MKNKVLKLSSIFTALLIVILIIVVHAGNRNHQAINNIYYGYYDDRNQQQFVILVFDKQYPSKVAVRVNLESLKFNSVFPIKYDKDNVIVKGQEGDIILSISSDLMTLTCSHCDDRKLPKIYNMGVDHHAFPTATVNQAFEEITEDAKTQNE